jgi:predicted DNA-binding transcriptional regulator
MNKSPDKDRIAGLIILLFALLLGSAYAYLLFFASIETQLFVMKLTSLVVVETFFLVVAWIGITLLLSPPEAKIREIEKRLEEEYNKLRKQGYPFPW